MASHNKPTISARFSAMQKNQAPAPKQKARPSTHQSRTTTVTTVPVSFSTNVEKNSSRGQPRGNMRNGVYSVSHSEFVDTISSIDPDPATAGLFTLIGKSIEIPGYDNNPGNAILYPWLSNLATSYEMFTFSSLRFRLLPKQSTSSVGWVTMGFDYDPADQVAASKRDILQNLSVTEGSSYRELHLTVDCSLLNRNFKERYVQAVGTIVPNQDIRLINAGFLQLGLDGAEPNVMYGWDLWVDYSVQLRIPRSATELTDQTETDRMATVIGYTTTQSPNVSYVAAPLPSSLGSALGTVETITQALSGITLTMPPSVNQTATGTFNTPVIKLSGDIGDFSHLLHTTLDPFGIPTNVPATATYWAWDALGRYLGPYGLVDAASTVLAGAGWVTNFYSGQSTPPVGTKYLAPVCSMTSNVLSLGAQIAASVALRYFKGYGKQRV